VRLPAQRGYLFILHPKSGIMIQRIQTLFLAGVLVVSGFLFSLPMYSMVIAGEPLKQVFSLRENIFLSCLNGLILAGALAAIFLYKHRNLQVRICSLLMLLVSILIVSVFLFFRQSRHYRCHPFI
jgi:peptidoglycan/LPS O-acetylase OafA/YrhL